MRSPDTGLQLNITFFNPSKLLSWKLMTSILVAGVLAGPISLYCGPPPFASLPSKGRLERERLRTPGALFLPIPLRRPLIAQFPSHR